MRKFKDVQVSPLYNVWDQMLQPPDHIDDRNVPLAWVPDRTAKEGMVRVPWRGG